MKRILGKYIPSSALNIYHYSLAKLGAIIYGFPSEKMVIIGVTGTKGKTSTSNFIWSTLMAGGQKTGIVTSANFRIGDQEKINGFHMTMPGRFFIQKTMSDMVKAGCKYCIIETTSQGIKQFRHIGINYDVAVFTNIFPEHLESHGGSFEIYKQEKGKLFSGISKSKAKTLNGKKVDKVIIVNKDSDHAEYFLNLKSDKNISFSTKGREADYKTTNIENTPSGVSFELNNDKYSISLLGKFNVANALPAVIISKLFGIKDENIKKGLENLKNIPGRMEIIDQGQNFTVIVDYAHEKESMTNLLQTANSIKKEGAKTIVIFGSEGGGRDKAKRGQMGQVTAELADYVIVTNTDPYDDDPKQIFKDITDVCVTFGKVIGKDLFTFEDRKEAIKKALSLANENDIILITGKGAEQTMMVADGKSIPWDDRVIVRDLLASK